MLNLSLLAKADQFAARAHAGQVRKFNNIAFITHPREVATLVRSLCAKTETIAAALLHDVVEDTDFTIADIAQEFGPVIAGIVSELTEPGTDDSAQKAPWRERKLAYLEHLNNSSPPAYAVALADKIVNAEDFLALISDNDSVDVLAKFNAGPELQIWWWEQVLATFQSRDRAQLYLDYGPAAQLVQNGVTRLQEAVKSIVLRLRLHVAEQRVRVGVATLIMNKEGKVLLGRRRGSHAAGYYAFPGGHIDYGEDIKTCVAREVHEETGLDIVSVHDLGEINNFFPEDRRHYVTLVKQGVLKDVNQQPELRESEKCEGWGWYSLDDMPQPLWPGLAEFLNKQSAFDLSNRVK